MPIPIVAGTLVAPAPYTGAEANANALMAPGAALVGLGQSVRQAGQVAEEFAMRKQHAVNTADVMDAGLKMEQASADYQNEMSRNQDEETWVPNWQKNIAKVKGQVLGDPKLAPVVREKLENQFKEFETSSTIQVTTQANVRTIQRQKGRLMNVADTMWQNGDFERGKIAIEAMQSAGLVNDDEAREILRKGEVKVDFNNANRGIATDPIATLDALSDATDGGRWRNFTALDENQRESLRVEARRQVSAVRAETVNGLVDRRNAGEIIPGEELQDLVDGRKLTATQMKWILQEQKRATNDPGVTKHFADLLRDIDTYRKAPDDPTNEKFAELTARRMLLPPEMREEAQRRLDKAANPSSDHQQTKLATGYIDDLLQGGYFGPLKQDTGTMDQAEKAYGQAIELKRDLERFVQANPAALNDPVKQRDFVNAKIRGKLDVASATPVLNSLTGAAVTKSTPAGKVLTRAQRDALAPGSTYLGADGKTYTRGNK